MSHAGTGEDDIDVTAFRNQRTAFFAEAGKCIIEYQKCEEHLEDIFTAALGGSTKRATSIFAVIRGLEAKLDAITAALSDADASRRERWDELRKLVGRAAAARNQIAHSRPVSVSDPIIIVMDVSRGEPVSASGGGNSRTEVRKKTRSGDVTWTQQLLREEFLRNFNLFRALIDFERQLRGEPTSTPPEGL